VLVEFVKLIDAPVIMQGAVAASLSHCCLHACVPKLGRAALCCCAHPQGFEWTACQRC
jgi:hypothetical protein